MHLLREHRLNVFDHSSVVSVVAKGDKRLLELERVYRSEFGAFMRTATAYLGDVDAARDAVQEGVAVAIGKRATYRGEGTLEAWLWRVVLNAIRDRYRETAHLRLVAGDAYEESTAAVAPNGHVTTDTVRSAVRRLPERQRLVLFLRFYADMDYATIAELLEMSTGTVGASLNAARTTLRSLLQEVRT
jgi:RNA polymerase sigma factor (sigma-70 family)